MACKGKFIVAALPALALAACSGGSGAGNDAAADNVSNGTDPALTAALQDQIMVDPGLTQQANGDAVRPPSQPYSGALPSPNVAANNGGAPGVDGELLHAPAPKPADKSCTQCQASRDAVTLGGVAARQKDARTSGCAGSLQYSAAWATRLPRDLPLYPQAHVTEAAGSTQGQCALRVVSFAAPQPVQAVIDWYYTKAIRAGYSAEHQLDGDEHVLGGTREKDGGAYVLFLTPRSDGGTDVDLVANNGI